MDSGYDLYSLSEEHQLLRKAVRQLAEDKIAPRAAEIDEKAEYPRRISYIIGPDGKIEHAFEKIDTKTHPAAVLALVG